MEMVICAILGFLCILLCIIIFTFIGASEKRFSDLEDDLDCLERNKASKYFIESLLESKADKTIVEALKRDVGGAHINCLNLEAQLDEYKNVLNGLREDISELKSSININDDSLSEYQKSIKEEISKLNLSFDCLYEDYKRLKVKVKRLDICETCNDFILRSLDRKVKILMNERIEKDV